MKATSLSLIHGLRLYCCLGCGGEGAEKNLLSFASQAKLWLDFFVFLFVCKLMPPCGCLQNRQIFLKWISLPVWDHLTVLCSSVSLQITNAVLYLGEIFWNTQFKDTIFGLFWKKKCIFYLLDVLILNLIPFLFYNAMLQGKNSVLEQEQINTATLQSQFRNVKKDMYVKWH